MMLALFVTLAILYWRAPFSEFLNYDDDLYVTNNPHIAQGLSLNSIGWAFTSTEYSAWTPLTWLSLGLDASIHGLRPSGFHLTNLLLHIGNALLLFLLIRKWTLSPWIAFLVAYLWSIHPLHVEPVMWISERKGLLSTFFGLLALLQWSRYKTSPDRKAYILTHVMLALSIMAKPMLITFPALLLLLDHWPFKKLESATIKPLIKEKLGFLIICLLGAWMALYSQDASGAVKPTSLFPADQRLTIAVGGYFDYFIRALIPLPINEYSIFHPIPINPDTGRLFAGLAVVQGLLIVAFKCRHSRPEITVGILWFLGTLVPVMGAVKIGIQGPADRYCYLPLMGGMIALAYALIHLMAISGKPWICLAAGMFVSGFLQPIVTSKYSARWSDSVTLFNHALAATRENPLLLNQIGLAHSRNGDKEKAIPYFQRAIDHRETQLAVGDGQLENGQTAQAIRTYLDVLRFQPDHPRAHNNLAIAYARESLFTKAEHHWTEAINHGNFYLEAYENLAKSFREQGFTNQANIVLLQAIKEATATGSTNEIQRIQSQIVPQ